MSLGGINIFAAIGVVFLGSGVVAVVWGVHKLLTVKKVRIFYVGLLFALTGLLLLAIANQASSSV